MSHSTCYVRMSPIPAILMMCPIDDVPCYMETPLDRNVVNQKVVLPFPLSSDSVDYRVLRMSTSLSCHRTGDMGSWILEECPLTRRILFTSLTRNSGTNSIFEPQNPTTGTADRDRVSNCAEDEGSSCVQIRDSNRRV